MEVYVVKLRYYGKCIIINQVIFPKCSQKFAVDDLRPTWNISQNKITACMKNQQYCIYFTRENFSSGKT